MIVYDLETAPLDRAYLAMTMPEIKASGTLKDPVKIAADIQAKTEAYFEEAALDAKTGKILCIGIMDDMGSFTCMDGGGSEKQLLIDWQKFVDNNQSEIFVGFNSHSFDLPYLVRRAWFHNVKPCVRPDWNPYRQDQWIDLLAVFRMGDKTYKTGGLSGIASFFGAGQKTGSGKDFAQLWETDLKAALTYLEQDLALTAAIARRMGF